METYIDPDFLSRVIGKTIKITLTYGCFQGVLIHVDPGRTILVSKVKDLSTGKTLPGTQLFFGQEILNVELHKDLDCDQETKGQTTEEREHSPSEECLKNGENVDVETSEILSTVPQEISINVLQFIKRAVDDEEVKFIVVDQFQPLFGSAIRHIQNQSVLGLGAAGMNLCRHGKLCWLQVATRNCIYLFDILVLGPKAFKNGLQMVLENKHILKVIHDCRRMADFLSHQYRVALNNVFDTQVGDVYLFSVETGGFLPSCTSTLEECLRHHLNMPPSRLSFLTHIQKLVKLSSSELPEELQRLSVLQQMKREKALKEYEINSKGFLIRGKTNTDSQKTETFRVQMFLPSDKEPAVNINGRNEPQIPQVEKKECELFVSEKEEVKQLIDSTLNISEKPLHHNLIAAS